MPATLSTGCIGLIQALIEGKNIMGEVKGQPGFRIRFSISFDIHLLWDISALHKEDMLTFPQDFYQQALAIT